VDCAGGKLDGLAARVRNVDRWADGFGQAIDKLGKHLGLDR
jgi:hypothetical protein